MADGNKIDIHIAATGGDQAAAEVKKVDDAVKKEAVSLDTLQKELNEATAAYKKAEVGSKEFEAAANRLAAAEKGLAAAKGTVSASSVNMRTQLSNVGFQVQDFAVQVASGTAASRAFAQQAPQLLSAFGPVGVLLGTLAAVGVPLVASFASQGEAADGLADKLEKLTKKRQELADQKAAADTKKWIEALDDEEAAIKRQTEAMQDNLRVFSALLAARATSEDAKIAAEEAGIDADPKLSEADRAAAKGSLAQRRLNLRKEVEDRESQIRIAGADQKAEAAVKASTDADADVKATRDRMAAEKAEAADLKGRIIAANQAGGRTGDLKKRIKDLDDENYRAGLFGEAGVADYLPRRKALEKQLEESELAAGAVSNKERKRYQELAGDDGRTGSIKALTDALEGLVKKAVDANDASARAVQEAGTVRGIESGTQADRDRTFVSRTQENASRTDLSMRKAREAADQKAAEERQKKRGFELDDQEDAADDRLDETARQSGLRIRGKGNRGSGERNKLLQQIGGSLADGTDAGEIQKIGDLVREKQALLGRETVAALTKVLEELSRLVAEMEGIKGQIKNNRRGGNS